MANLKDEIEGLWQRLMAAERALRGADPGEAPFVKDGAIVHEVLDPKFLRAQLERIQGEGGGALSEDQYGAMYAELDREDESPVSGASAEQGGQALLPRSPAVSMLQSTLTACVTSRFEDLLKPLPPGQRSFAEWVLRETDVFRQFGPCDAKWMETVIAQGLSLLDGRAPFPDEPAADVELARDARVVVVGDWGTGLPGARAVGAAMAHCIAEGRSAGREVHALHLGDVYYSGWKEEYRSRFLPFWPVRSASEGVASWTLNGNHDMYSGGHGYFGYLLNDERFKAQSRSSHFCLQNEYWQLLGLDTAYSEEDLAGNQQAWVEGKLRASERKTMLLTHHQPFSAFEQVDPPFLAKLRQAFAGRRVDAWLWGHEHMCCAYETDLQPYLGFGSCIGHGGVPVLLWEGSTPPGVRWRFTESEVHEGADRWQLFGFAVLDFADDRIEVQYRDQNGRTVETLTIE